MTVVSNTSPLINLAAVGHLDLLQQLYNSIKIPQTVSHEMANIGVGEARIPNWIQTSIVANGGLVTALMLELDPGEAEAIALAVELPADLLLMDERIGRRVATRLGLKFTGRRAD